MRVSFPVLGVKMMIEDKVPIQLKSGEFGCPSCKTQLVPGKVEMYYNKKPLGYFDGLKCKICNYGLITEQGMIDSDNVIKYGTQSSSNEIINLGKSGEGTNYVNELQGPYMVDNGG